MADLVAELREAFIGVFGREGQGAFFSPGRVNLIGEYTDINGGHVFPCAISLGTYAVAARRDDRLIRLYSLNQPKSGILEAELDRFTKDDPYGWARYPLGVVHTLRARGLDWPTGADIVFHGNLPSGAGLSSSASIEVLTGVIFNQLYGLGLDAVRLALIGQEAENGFVGVQCGIMDQFAVAMGRKGQAILLQCATLEHRYRPLDTPGVSLVITHTNKPRSLADSKYNERRAECDAALADLRTLGPLENLCELSLAEFNEKCRVIKGELPLKRARHVVGENERTLAAAEALARGDLESFGALMKASHISLRDDFEVSGRELDTLAELAWGVPGVIGSRMTGAGFGGCTISLVREEALGKFKTEVTAGYEKAIGWPPSFYPAESANGAERI